MKSVKKRSAPLADKNQYQRQLSIYLKRRDNINKKIRLWRLAIKAIEVKDDRVFKLIKLVEDYTSINLLKDKSNKPKTVFARRVFFKYGIENGIDGAYLSETLGMFRRAGYKGRKELNLSFKTNPDNLKEYHDFVQYTKLT